MVLDAGALVALERGSARMIALVRQVGKSDLHMVVPAGALGQVWRDGARQARIAKLLGSPQVDVAALDRRAAQLGGVLCGRAGTSDIVDAHVVVCAQRHGRCPVLTSDPDDLLELDPRLTVEDPG